jgi:signal peptidase II
MKLSARTLRGPLAIAAVVVLVDQLTKQWALSALDDDRVVHVIWTLRFNLAYNKGMAFSKGDWLGPAVPILAIAVAVVLLVSVRRSASNRWFTAAVGLVIGGSLGNVIDRLFRNDGWFDGAVVDFIDLQWWPIFNVADIAIVVGGGVLLLLTLRSP